MAEATNPILGTRPSKFPCETANGPKKAAGTPGQESADRRKAAQGLESLFIYELLKSMRATVPKSGLFGGGGHSDQYMSMFDLHLAENLAMRGELGIASLVERQLENSVGKENAAGTKVSVISADE